MGRIALGSGGGWLVGRSQRWGRTLPPPCGGGSYHSSHFRSHLPAHWPGAVKVFLARG